MTLNKGQGHPNWYENIELRSSSPCQVWKKSAYRCLNTTNPTTFSFKQNHIRRVFSLQQWIDKIKMSMRLITPTSLNVNQIPFKSVENSVRYLALKFLLSFNPVTLNQGQGPLDYRAWNCSWKKKRKFLGGSGGMLPRKILKVEIKICAIWGILEANLKKSSTLMLMLNISFVPSICIHRSIIFIFTEKISTHFLTIVKNLTFSLSPTVCVCVCVCVERERERDCILSQACYPKIHLSVPQTVCVRIFRFIIGLFSLFCLVLFCFLFCFVLLGFFCECTNIQSRQKSVKGQFFYHIPFKNSMWTYIFNKTDALQNWHTMSRTPLFCLHLKMSFWIKDTRTPLFCLRLLKSRLTVC